MTIAVKSQPRADSDHHNIATPFYCGVGQDSDWRQAVAQVLLEIGETSLKHRLGIFYVSEAFQPHISDIEILLRQTTGVPHWVGAGGYGVIGSRDEYFNVPAISVLLVEAPDDAFRVFSMGREGPDAFLAENEAWLTQAQVPIALVHANPISGQVPDHILTLEDEAGAYVFGGLGSASVVGGFGSEGAQHHSEDLLGGVMFSPQHIAIQTVLTQGCSPISETHRVTKAEGHVIYTLDGEPALDVLIRDLGPIPGGELRNIAGEIFAALPVKGSDTGDYLIRSLIGIDPDNRLIAIGESLSLGDQLMFARRGAEEAVTDMRRMLTNLKSRVGTRAVRGGIYISCCARGPNQFTAPEDETTLIREVFGDIPLTGFFANGEISAGRFYGFTGILAVFL